MTEKILLREYLEFSNRCDESLLTEDERQINKNGGLILAGILQRADSVNQNGRVYPLEILRREVENYKKLVKENRALGATDHPDSSVVELATASHLVTEIEMRGKDVFGKVKVLSTPMGNIIKALIADGVKIGISSRALGSVKNHNGNSIVGDDLQLLCFDFVSDPSCHGAFMIKEGREYQNKMFTRADRLNRALNDLIKG